jgi:hypothetical protein
MTPDPIQLTAGLNQNCQLFRGEDKAINVTMTGYDPATAMELQWWLAKSAWSLDTEPDEVLIKKSLTEGIAVTGSDVTITVDAIDTVAILPDLYYHELKIVQADGTIKVAMAGNIVIRMALKMETTL